MAKESSKKIISLQELDNILPSIDDKKKVLVGGGFDIVHFGHVSFLEKAKKFGEVLMVLLESDEFIKKYKRKQPFHTQNQRAYMLSHLDMVDYVVLLPLMEKNEKYFDIVKQIKPSVIAVTEHDSKIELKKQQAKEVGATVEVASGLLPVSTTAYETFSRH